jgi:hypothetical protein
LAFVLGPAALLGFGVVLDVHVGKLAESQDIAGGTLLHDGVAPLRDAALRFARELARVGQGNRGEPSQRETLLLGALIAIEQRPGADVVGRHPKREPRRQVIEVVHAAAGRRRQL